MGGRGVCGLVCGFIRQPLSTAAGQLTRGTKDMGIVEDKGVATGVFEDGMCMSCIFFSRYSGVSACGLKDRISHGGYG